MSTDYKQIDEIKSLNLQLKDLNTAIIKSSESSDKSSRAMFFLTGGLVVFAFVQSIAAWLSYRADQEIIGLKKSCYQSILQTSDFDLNYKSCLRRNGLSD